MEKDSIPYLHNRVEIRPGPNPGKYESVTGNRISACF